MKRNAVALSFARLAVGIAGLAVSCAWADPILYSQPSDFPGGTVFASQNDTGGGFGNFATVYDDFILPGNDLVTDVHWQGGFFNPGHGTITAFTVAFYADNAGQPGAALLTQTIAGNANETFVGNQFFGPVYDYSVVLTTPFATAAGTQYWMSIVPTTNFPPQWGWHTGTGGDGIGYQDFFGTRSPTGTDFAFALTGVPEPATLALVGLGLVSLAVHRSRRRRQSEVGGAV